jgi:hypothetical protein
MLNNLTESTAEPIKRPPLWAYNVKKDGSSIDHRAPFVEILGTALAFLLVYGSAFAISMIPWQYAIGTIVTATIGAMLLGLAWRAYSAIAFRNRLFGFIYSIEQKTHPMIVALERATVEPPSFVTVIDNYRRLFEESMAYIAQNAFFSPKLKKEGSRVLFNSFLGCLHRIPGEPRGVVCLGRIGNETPREHIDRLLFVIQWVSGHLPKAEADKFISPIAFFINDMSCANDIPLVRADKTVLNNFVLLNDCIAAQYYSTPIFDGQFQIPIFQAIFNAYLSKEDSERLEKIGFKWSEETEPGFCRKKSGLAPLPSGHFSPTLDLNA